MTYNSLVLQIKAETERTDAANAGLSFTDQIPNFISFAQQRICRESKSLLLEQYVVGNFVAGNPVIQKPGRWRRTLTLNFGIGTLNNTRNQLQIRSYELLRTYWPDPTSTGLPLYYADYGFNNILIAPTPDQNYPFELGYLEEPEAITVAHQTNSLTNYAPDLLFAACMIEAVLFLKNFPQVDVWKDKYSNLLQGFNNQDDLRIIDRASDRGAD